MSKFYNYLNESLNVKELQKCIDDIKKYCKPFLNEWMRYKGNNCLYKGDIVSKLYDIRDMSKNYDKNIDKWFLDISDEMFKQLFNINLLKQSLFTTSNTTIANDNGEVCAIFPIGKYTLYTSNNDSFYDEYYKLTNDYYIYTLEEKGYWKYKNEIEGGHKRGFWWYKGNKYYGEESDDVVDMMMDDYPDDSYEDITDNIEWECEISLSDYIDEYVEEKQDELSKILYNEFESNYYESDLKSVLKQDNEILTNCKKYIIVNEKYIPFITMYFKKTIDPYINSSLFNKNKEILNEIL